jgi:hypothetical protein
MQVKWMEIEIKSHMNKDTWHNDFYPVVRSSRKLAYSTLWCPNEQVHSTSFKWSKDQLEYQRSTISRCEESPQFGVSRLTQMISNEHKSKGNSNTQERELQQQHAHKTRTSTRNSTSELQLKEVLGSLSRWTKCVFAKSRRCRMFNGCLVYCSMRLGVPFIAPRELGAVGVPFGRP